MPRATGQSERNVVGVGWVGEYLNALPDFLPLRGLAAKAERLILDRGAALAPHSGRTLYAHLRGVHELLSDWGRPEHECVAGLCHSIYGTDGYQTSLASVAERDFVRTAIGAQAENLVFAFASYEHLELQPDLKATLSESALRSLSFIALANGVEQLAAGAGDPEMLQAAIALAKKLGFFDPIRITDDRTRRQE